jgi:hypothetical protein
MPNGCKSVGNLEQQIIPDYLPDVVIAKVIEYRRRRFLVLRRLMRWMFLLMIIGIVVLHLIGRESIAWVPMVIGAICMLLFGWSGLTLFLPVQCARCRRVKLKFEKRNENTILACGHCKRFTVTNRFLSNYALERKYLGRSCNATDNHRGRNHRGRN